MSEMPTADDEFVYSEEAASVHALPFWRSGYRHGCRDERQRVLAELTAEETIDWAVTAAYYSRKPHEVGGDWFALSRDEQVALTSDIEAALKKAASLVLGSEEETIGDPIEKPQQPVEADIGPDPAPVGETRDAPWGERAARAIEEGTAYLLRADPELTRERARSLAWGVLSSAQPWIIPPTLGPLGEALASGETRDGSPRATELLLRLADEPRHWEQVIDPDLVAALDEWWASGESAVPVGGDDDDVVALTGNVKSTKVCCPGCKRRLGDVFESLIRQRGKFKAQRNEARRALEHLREGVVLTAAEARALGERIDAQPLVGNDPAACACPAGEAWAASADPVGGDGLVERAVLSDGELWGLLNGRESQRQQRTYHLLKALGAATKGVNTHSDVTLVVKIKPLPIPARLSSTTKGPEDGS